MPEPSEIKRGAWHPSRRSILNSHRKHDNQIPTTYQCTDLGNMQRFINQHKDYTRSTSSGSWFKWNGKRWKPVSRADIFNLARKTVYSIQKEASRATAGVEANEINKWALVSQSEAKIRSMINMAGKHEDILIDLSAFDRDRSKINCLNGIIDLTNGNLLPRSPDDYVSKIIEVEYKPGTKAPRFQTFINQVFGNDKELIGWVQRALGYTLSGLREEQLMFIGYGSGANGKSTLLEVIARIMNDYTTTASFNTFLAGKSSDIRSMEAVGKLKGMRLALASEPDSDRRFREDIIKQLTGDAILRGARLHGESFEFRPQFKLWLLANHMPSVRDVSHGYWRRIKVIPFNQRFEGHKLDSMLPDKLWQEREGILSWLVEGAVAYHEALGISNSTGLGPCRAIDEQVDQYRYDNDLPKRFLADCTRQSRDSRVPARDLYQAFCSWCQGIGDDDVITETVFSKRMKELGLKKPRTNAGMVYLDVVLVSGNYQDNHHF